MAIRAVIFDLDGVIVSTDEFHYQGWQKLADEEGVYFDRTINERLRGVSRMDSLDILLEKSDKEYTDEQKQEMATRKNNYYRELLKNLSPEDLLPGAMQTMEELKKRGIKVAIGSSSKNTPTILEYIGLSDYFDAVSDGNQISKSKPDPEVFLLAAKKMGVPAEECVVVEDAAAGVEAAIRGNMKALGVGSAAEDQRAHLRAKDLSEVTVDQILGL